MNKLHVKNLKHLADAYGMSVGEFLDYCLANPESIKAMLLQAWEANDEFGETLDIFQKDVAEFTKCVEGLRKEYKK